MKKIQIVDKHEGKSLFFFFYNRGFPGPTPTNPTGIPHEPQRQVPGDNRGYRPCQDSSLSTLVRVVQSLTT